MMSNLPAITPEQYRFTLCFLYHQENVLMIERNKEPNLGLWNGVGGHIEVGESPEISCLREIEEETGIVVPSLRFGGVLTWESWSFESGGMYIFSADVSDSWFRPSDEGFLAWKPYDWVMTSPSVVENISEFMPDTREKRDPRWYHCLFDQEELLETRRYPLPEWVTNDWIRTGRFGI
jgi:8-oxo-dGTP diphosphatase